MGHHVSLPLTKFVPLSLGLQDHPSNLKVTVHVQKRVSFTELYLVIYPFFSYPAPELKKSFSNKF